MPRKRSRNNSNHSKQINLRISPKLTRRLDKYSESSDLTRSQVIRAALKFYLDKAAA